MLLHFLRWLRANSEMELHVLLISGGELAPDFAALAPVTFIAPQANGESIVRSLLHRASWGDPLLWPPPTVPRAEHVIRLGARRALVGDIRRRLGAAACPDVLYLNSVGSARALSLFPKSLPVITHVTRWRSLSSR